NPQRIAAGPDGNLWFTEYDASQIGVITPSGTIHEYPLTSGVSPLGIGAGPDGNVWFTEDQGNSVGRITTAGSVTRLPVPAPHADPAGITTGADGELWFSEFFPDKIGRLVPPGTTLTPNSGPAGGGTAITVAGLDFADGVTVSIGGVPATGVSVAGATRL